MGNYYKILFTQNSYYLYDAINNKVIEIDGEVADCIENGGMWDDTEVVRKYEKVINDNNFRDIRQPYHIEFNHNWNITDLENRYRNVNAIFLSLTERCNLKCSYCTYYYKYHSGYIPKKMNWEVAKKAIDLIAKNNTPILSIGFYGGECLLEFPLIEKCVEYAKKISYGRKLRFSLTTNGILLKEMKIRRFLSKHSFDVLLSLDGPAIINDRYRNNDGVYSYEKVINSLKMWYEEDEDYVKDNVKINAVLAPPISRIIMDDFFNSFPIECNYSSLKPISEFTPDQDMGEVFQKINKRYNPALYENIYYKRISLVYKKYHELPQFNTDLWIPGASCVPGHTRLYVDVNGNLYPCEKVDESDEYVIGNVDSGIDINKAVYISNMKVLVISFVDVRLSSLKISSDTSFIDPISSFENISSSSFSSIYNKYII